MASPAENHSPQYAGTWDELHHQDAPREKIVLGTIHRGYNFSSRIIAELPVSIN
jgi:hypothetical protein